MKKMKPLFRLAATVLITSCCLAPSIVACTGIQIQTKNNEYVTGRTAEFGVPLQLNGLIIPRHYTFTGTTDKGNGLIYKSKYAAVGVSAYGSNYVLDGFNEKGLTVGMFYFPNFASYTPLDAQNQSRAVAPTEFVNWILTQFASIEEVRNAIERNEVVIVPTTVVDWGGIPPMHYIVYDKQGKSIAIEPIAGRLQITDNPVGVFTNSPEFSWHLTNLSNYINLSTINVEEAKIKNYEIKQLGLGTGLLGMPGDFTPPSRFVRAAIFANAATPVDTSLEAVFETFHILNQFDIPPGSARAPGKENAFKPGSMDITLATAVKDPNTLIYYYKTYDNQNIRSIDLKRFDWNNEHLQRISSDQGPTKVEDVSHLATPDKA
ncbi:MAG: choloylglycine hydrolase [Verrucomicrobia bacterium CG_4_10_14_3_um_filter_43_23]|nr:MAG: hypothetical protein AUJ82_07580 [Verrucomicrobia bacterium CG1_02_43_26]PIP58634.1 MAG: choloylglycine hydrolase [Verrucomicrobia bacterium CG22_combo_CG10-13_8_21_14_all_43_17]PIX58390.1 MAG: choloylglycine hydrolase [Verrucomicrobia bacterium CG_4_10_14_3_um_filter_43_23]PIY61228.1 MAG: choloylglycine hydrolase [Verrucomicrobia bacterium CG_4_10_14_0_8_um_filter_43_34]PJA44957.1 MAG: choloylglycine hydrolase [Verrucomicrobia bacterium CG_4_9_14_3_um_filter_43_20]